MDDLLRNKLGMFLDSQEQDLAQKYVVAETNYRYWNELFEKKTGGKAKEQELLAQIEAARSTKEQLVNQLKNIRNIRNEILKKKLDF